MTRNERSTKFNTASEEQKLSANVGNSEAKPPAVKLVEPFGQAMMRPQ